MKLVFIVSLLFLGVSLNSQVNAQNVILQSGVYDDADAKYPAYASDGSVTGTYTITLAKDSYSFTSGQFDIKVGFPPGIEADLSAATLVVPAEFSVSGSGNNVNIAITGTWSGSGPSARRIIVIPIKIVGPVVEQPTGTSLQWLDPFVTENNSGNTTGPVVSVEDVNLPVILTHFAVVVEGNTNQLTWSTTQETNSDRFDVERSADAKNWQKIGTVKSHGESTVLRDYKLTDGAPLVGLNYYRLKMVDKDATYEYSRIVSAEFAGKPSYVYPNPSSGNFRINENLIVSSLELTNISGQVIPSHLYRVKANNQVDAEGLPAGLYLVKIKQVNGTTALQKLVISK